MHPSGAKLLVLHLSAVRFFLPNVADICAHHNAESQNVHSAPLGAPTDLYFIIKRTPKRLRSRLAISSLE